MQNTIDKLIYAHLARRGAATAEWGKLLDDLYAECSDIARTIDVLRATPSNVAAINHLSQSMTKHRGLVAAFSAFVDAIPPDTVDVPYMLDVLQELKVVLPRGVAAYIPPTEGAHLPVYDFIEGVHIGIQATDAAALLQRQLGPDIANRVHSMTRHPCSVVWLFRTAPRATLPRPPQDVFTLYLTSATCNSAVYVGPTMLGDATHPEWNIPGHVQRHKFERTAAVTTQAHGQFYEEYRITAQGLLFLQPEK
jgi:hypothetical protein